MPAPGTKNSTSPHLSPEGSDQRGTHELGHLLVPAFPDMSRGSPPESSTTQRGCAVQASLPEFSGVTWSLEDMEVPRGGENSVEQEAFAQATRLPKRPSVSSAYQSHGSSRPHRDSSGQGTLCSSLSHTGVVGYVCHCVPRT